MRKVMVGLLLASLTESVGVATLHSFRFVVGRSLYMAICVLVNGPLGPNG